jgi:hypothetical protein
VAFYGGLADVLAAIAMVIYTLTGAMPRQEPSASRTAPGSNRTSTRLASPESRREEERLYRR